MNAVDVSTQECYASTRDDRYALSGLATLLLCLAGLILPLCLFGTTLFSAARRGSDFLSFRVGAQLLGTRELYNVPSHMAVQRELIGSIHPGIPYARPPFFAAAMKPFMLMSYHSAATVWEWLMVAALVASACIFPIMPRRYAALALCWSVPAAIAVQIASDAPIILLLVTLSLVCWKKGREALAGIMLGLCLAKFHFLVFLPLLLFQRQYRRVLAGFAATVGALIAVNFIVQPDWIPLYWKGLSMPQHNLSFFASKMPDFYGIFFGTGHAAMAVIPGALLIGAILWRVRHLPFELAMPLSITGGLFAAPHTGWNDLVIAIPAFLLIAYQFRRLRLMAVILLSPMAFLATYIGPPNLATALLIALSLWLMYEAPQFTSSGHADQKHGNRAENI